MKALALINDTAGTVARTGEESLRDIMETGFADAGWTADFETGDAPALIEIARRAEGYDAVVCAGGDGTQAAIAGALLGSDAALLPLPCGTVNLFCRDIGLSMDIGEALAAGLRAPRRCVDVGRISAEEIGERFFLNNIVFGAYADLAEAREDLRNIESFEDVSFALVGAAQALVHAKPTDYLVEVDGKSRAFHSNTLIVSNNAFTHSEELLPRRARIDEGALAVYLVGAEGGAGFTARLIEFVTGGADASEQVELCPCKTCTISKKAGDDDGAPLVYSIDGDPQEAAGPVSMSIDARALNVLAPDLEG